MLKISTIQFHPVLCDVGANINKLKNGFDQAWESDLVVLPELASTGYVFQNRDEAYSCAESINTSQYVAFLKQQASQYRCYIVSGINEAFNGRLYNSSVLIGPEGTIGVYRKLHLFNLEKDIFTPGSEKPMVYTTALGKIGMLICFDWMFPEVWRMLSINGAQVVCHPSNLVLPYCQSVVPSHALLNRFYTVTSNRVGKERDLEFTGQSVICSPMGKVIARGSDQDEEVLQVEVNLSLSNDKWVTPQNHLLKDRRSDIYGQFKVE